MGSYVGIDLHRRRSVIVVMNGEGEVQSTTRIDNDPVALVAAVAAAGPDPEVVVGATGASTREHSRFMTATSGQHDASCGRRPR